MKPRAVAETISSCCQNSQAASEAARKVTGLPLASGKLRSHASCLVSVHYLDDFFVDGPFLK